MVRISRVTGSSSDVSCAATSGTAASCPEQKARICVGFALEPSMDGSFSARLEREIKVSLYSQSHLFKFDSHLHNDFTESPNDG